MRQNHLPGVLGWRGFLILFGEEGFISYLHRCINLICSVVRLVQFLCTTFLLTTISSLFQESVTYVPDFFVTSLPGLYHYISSPLAGED